MIKLNIQRFASGSFELAKATGNASWKSLQGKIEWSSVASGSEENQSIVTTKLYARTWTGGTSGKNWRGSVKVGSNTAHSFSSLSSQKTIASSYVLLATYTDTIKHNDDGTCSINISGYVQGPNGTSLEGIKSSGNKIVTLDIIPRATTLDSFSGSKRIGVANDVIINFTKRKSTFTTTLAYATQEDLSDLTEIVTKTTNANTYSWTIPISLLNKIPNSKTLDIYVLLATFDGDTQIGTSQISNFTAIVYEDNCKPIWNTHTIEETDTTAKQLVTTANKFIANLSKPKFTFSATGQYGATISYYQINNTTRSSGFIDSNFNTNGYTLKVVDSRGVANTYTFNLTYVPYFTPVFEEVKLFRDVPTSNKVFSYFKIKFFNNTSEVKFDNPQALSYKFNYQERDGTTQEKIITPTISDNGTSRYAENETELGNTFNYKKSIDWTFFFVDLTGRTFKTGNTLPMGVPLMNGKMNEDGEQELYINGQTQIKHNNKTLIVSNDSSGNTLFTTDANKFNFNKSINCESIINKKYKKEFVRGAGYVSTPTYYLLAKLPASTAETGDVLNIKGYLGGYGSSEQAVIDVQIGNRGGLRCNGTWIGVDSYAFKYSRLRLYTNNGETYVYLMTNGWCGNIRLEISGMWNEIYDTFPSTTTPVGTLTLDVDEKVLNNASDVYSTDEIVIGKWINDKPIYRKVLDLGSVSTIVGTNQFNHNISNFDVLIKFNIKAYFEPQRAWYNWWEAYKSMTVDATQIRISTSVATTFSQVYITLEYTKTTD